MTKTMTHRERVRTALQHKQPDRLPIDFGGTFLSSAKPEMQEAIAEYLGLESERDPRFPYFDNRIQEHFDCDLRQIQPKAPRKWGFGGLEEAPMRDLSIDDLDKWPWPEPGDALVEGLREEAKFLHEETDYAICAAQVGQGIFEAGCYLRGYDQILLDMMMDEGFVHAFNQKVLETNLKLGDLYFAEIGPYVDIVLVGDDLAMQTQPYMNPETFRRLYKPYFAEYIAGIRKYCPTAFIGHHCCGAASSLYEDLIEIGVQISNPVQTTATGMKPEDLKAWKPRIAFHGGGDLQHVLPHGTTDEVRALTKELVENLSPDGGYILAPCHTLPEDVKPENISLFLEEGRRLGSKG
ncbi:MAG: uroporphyrinogen decarboxylase family protein [Candidatus Sumerlaeota bacterium]